MNTIVLTEEHKRFIERQLRRVQDSWVAKTLKKV